MKRTTRLTIERLEARDQLAGDIDPIAVQTDPAVIYQAILNAALDTSSFLPAGSPTSILGVTFQTAFSATGAVGFPAPPATIGAAPQSPPRMFLLPPENYSSIFLPQRSVSSLEFRAGQYTDRFAMSDDAVEHTSRNREYLSSVDHFFAQVASEDTSSQAEPSESAPVQPAVEEPAVDRDELRDESAPAQFTEE